ncbi:MAG: AAA family ATPase, partial [Gammaproteobacteria bacterium]|nr:AAA family ATPase [Gammaproteobacteria bacterium]
MTTADEARARAAEFKAVFAKVKAEVGKMVVGQEHVVDGVLTAMMAGGHVLLEGVPGLGKTMLVRTLSEAVSLAFSRIQFT